MLGAILIVSGPTVVTPVLALCRPGRKLTSILTWEGTTIDPIGALIGVLVFEVIRAKITVHIGREVFFFLANIGLGVLCGALGAAVLWVLLQKLNLSGIVATQATLGTVLVVAACSNALREDTGLVAALTMGIVLANRTSLVELENRRYLETTVQLVIGLLFVSISATVTPASLRGVVLPTLALVACLVLIVRPIVAAVSTARSALTMRERIFVGSMNPRGIVAASTATTFAVPLIDVGVGGAEKLLPATFIVIVVTVALYGLGATPVVRALGLGDVDDSSSPIVTESASGRD